MLRIGIMLDSLQPAAWVAGIITEIQRSSFGRVQLVVLNTPAPQNKPPLAKRPKNRWKLSLFHLYERWDYERHKSRHDYKAASDISTLLQGIRILHVQPERKGFSDHIAESDVEMVTQANLDVLLRFGFRIVRGKILDAARYGVWSIHHGDNLEYRGGPPLFWEIFEGNPVSGTTLQILTSAQNGGKVIYRGHSATNQRSLQLNRNPIYWKSAEYMLRRLKHLDEFGWKFVESLQTYTDETSISSKIYKTPNAWQMLQFLSRIFMRKVSATLKSRLRGGYAQWFLAIRKLDQSSRSYENTRNYQLSIPSPDRFYADPCLFDLSGRTYLFFEDFRYAENRAVISCCELEEDGTLGDVCEVLRRPYHLSYPFVFQWDNTIYMIPETRENRSVELYRAVEFPKTWELEALLLEDIEAVDATIHHDGKYFWLFVGLSNGKYSSCDELALFYANHLEGPWTAHRLNPVVSDVRRARPAGRLFVDDGMVVRPSQDCARAYGYATVFSEIVELSERNYEERQIARVTPEWAPGNLGTHTYSRSEKFEVIDGHFPHKPPR